MEIRLDNVLVNDDSVVELKRTHQLFTDEFYLGSTSAISYTLNLSKWFTLPATANVMTITDNGTTIATVQLDTMDDSNDRNRIYTFVDGMVNLSFYYNAQPLIEQHGGSATLRQIVEDICSKANLTLSESSFAHQSMSVSWYDDTITARDYIGYVATLCGGYAQINGAGKLEFVPFSATPQGVINVEQCDSFKLGEHHEITRVVYDNGVMKIEVGSETGDTIYLDTDNPYITGTEEEITTTLQGILDVLTGFDYYSCEIEKCPQTTAKAGQIVSVVDGDNVYPVINAIDQYYNLAWRGGLKSHINSSKQTETKVVNNTKSMIKSIKTLIDRQNALIAIKADKTELDELTGELVQQGTCFIVQPDGVYITADGDITNATRITRDGMRVIVDGDVVMEATKAIVNCKNGLGVNDWVIIQGSTPNTLNFMKRG